MDGYLRKTMLESGVRYYEQHLRVLNIMFPVKMTERELEMLSWWFEAGGGVLDSGKRSDIMAAMGLSRSGLSNIVGSLKAKGFIRESGEGLVMFGKLAVGEYEQGYVIRLIKGE
ncbi:MAG: hypothetical protein II063_10425 [Prevotella sp.]|nr:hypothetical protein [Prevotella sp.]